jgi:P27 family predicted phage terminase small subunit
MRGRKPLPSNVVRLRGNPGKRRLNDAEPRPAARVPACRACLGDEARKEWQRLAKELAELGLLTGIDRGLLAAYCQAHALWVEAVSSIECYGTMVSRRTASPCRAPMWRSLTGKWTSWCGLPPSSA